MLTMCASSARKGMSKSQKLGHSHLDQQHHILPLLPADHDASEKFDASSTNICLGPRKQLSFHSLPANSKQDPTPYMYLQHCTGEVEHPSIAKGDRCGSSPALLHHTQTI